MRKDKVFRELSFIALKYYDTFAKNIPLIRLAENNDWVVLILLGSVLAYVLMLMYLHREATLKEFLSQQISDTGNVLPTWLIVSVINCVLLAALISQYIPIVPRLVNNVSILGYSLNKFGFTLIVLSIFYFVKIVFTFLFYSSIGQDKKWKAVNFVASRFYFVFSIFLMIAVLVNYYFPIDKHKALQIFVAFVLLVFIFKNIFYSFNKNRILPNEWYYKILYICTLQIAPMLALWRVLFF